MAEGHRPAYVPRKAKSGITERNLDVNELYIVKVYRRLSKQDKNRLFTWAHGRTEAENEKK